MFWAAQPLSALPDAMPVAEGLDNEWNLEHWAISPNGEYLARPYYDDYQVIRASDNEVVKAYELTPRPISLSVDNQGHLEVIGYATTARQERPGVIDFYKYTPETNTTEHLGATSNRQWYPNAFYYLSTNMVLFFSDNRDFNELFFLIRTRTSCLGPI